MASKAGKVFFWVLLSGLIIGGSSYIYFKFIKKDNQDSEKEGEKDKSNPEQKVDIPEKGKIAYSNNDGIRVFNKKDMSVYKTSKKGDWLGTITGDVMLGGHRFYVLNDIRVVLADGTEIK